MPHKLKYPQGYNYHEDKEYIKKQRESHLDKKNPSYKHGRYCGYHKIKNCISCGEKCFGKRCQKCFLKVHNNFNKGFFKKGHKLNLHRKYSKTHRINISNSHKGILLGKKNPNWRGGISGKGYVFSEFNKVLKKQIRKRDKYKCQECGYSELQLGYKLRVHHIDYNKKNNIPTNLISLCKICHSQTNFKREDWSSYFQEKINHAIF